MNAKTYAAKSSVIRAIKAAKLNPEDFAITQNADGQWYAVAIPVEPKGSKPRNGNCLKVWEIADSLVGARRKDVIAACVEAGIPLGTSKTQYQHWFSSKK